MLLKLAKGYARCVSVCVAGKEGDRKLLLLLPLLSVGRSGYRPKHNSICHGEQNGNMTRTASSIKYRHSSLHTVRLAT